MKMRIPFLLLLSLVINLDAASAWKATAAKANITPKKNLWMAGYACHNTTTGVMEFNGDYAGWAQEYLEAEHPGTVALFVRVAEATRILTRATLLI